MSRQRAEKTAEQPAQFADPGDTLHLDGVKAEQQRAADRGPRVLDDATEQQKDQQDVEQVQDEVGRVEDVRVVRRQPSRGVGKGVSRRANSASRA